MITKEELWKFAATGTVENIIDRIYAAALEGKLIPDHLAKDKPQPEFSIDWPHGWQTRDGKEARLLASDIKLNDYPLVFAITLSSKQEIVVSRNQQGRFYSIGSSCNDDIINKPAPDESMIVYASPQDVESNLYSFNVRKYEAIYSKKYRLTPIKE